MSDNTQSFNYTIFSKEEIDKQFNSILEQCSTLSAYEEIIKTINTVFHNRIILMQNIEANSPDMHVYRVTREFKGFDSKAIKSFSYNPEQNLGRANLKGFPVFYCSLDPSTALKEMKSVLSLGEELYISEWHIKFTEPVYLHTVMINSTTEKKIIFASELIKKQLADVDKMLEKHTQELRQGLKQFLLRVGDLFTLKSEEHYKITSAYAHDALYGIKMKGGVNSMIMYPSVANGHKGINYAIHPDFVNSSMMELNQVFKLRVNNVGDDDVNITISEKGVNTEGVIDWKKPAIRIKEIEYDRIQIWTHDKNTFKGEDALNMPVNKSSISVKDLVKDGHKKGYILEFLKQRPFTDDIFEFNSVERKHSLLLPCDHGFKVETNSKNKVGCNCISHIQIPIIWIEEYS